MDVSELTSMVADLFAAIQTLAGYPVPERTPPITFAPRATMQKMVCQGECGVKAFYTPANGVFIDEAIDIKADVYARSVLLHELVHHLQHVSGKFDKLGAGCHRWRAKEVEAYEIQYQYLRRMNATRSFMALDTLGILCPEEHAAAAHPH